MFLVRRGVLQNTEQQTLPLMLKIIFSQHLPAQQQCRNIKTLQI